MLRIIAIIIILQLPYVANGEPNNLIGSLQYYRIQGDETFYDIARHFDLGIDEIMLANPTIDPWIPKVGTDIILPTAHLLPDAPRSGIVINLAEARLYYFTKTGDVKTFPVSIGIDISQTPVGITKIEKKRKDPTWIPPESIRAENPDLPKIVPAGDDNPLGKYAMNLESTPNFQWSRITIHGTNRPWSIGTPASHGCIRLYPEDIEVLFNDVDLGTKVTIVNQPVKLAMIDNILFMEAYPSSIEPTNLSDLISNYVKDESQNLSWDAINQALEERTGIPISISYK